MIRLALISTIVIGLAAGCTQTVPPELPSLIPAPVSMKTGKGSYLPKSGSKVRIILEQAKDMVHPGGYQLAIKRNGIRLTAPDSAGIFYGLQTLRRMVPVSDDGTMIPDSSTRAIPALEISDYPRFSWRGLMLDCSRTFLPVSYLKKTIDRMAMYKLNVLHLHLTDDQGWRVEIRKYPELTAVCSKFSPRYPGETNGFYTQKELRDLVAYAAARYITIVPEIEMPGHSTEVFAAYPQLSCRGKVTEIFPFFSGPGVTEDIYCAGKDSVFYFLQDVLDEVMSIFPSKYIHLGGDEAPKTRWKECPACQARIKSEKLRDESELQSYFVKRMTAYVHSKGRRVIGWDEILEGGLAEGAAVMSWRGTEGGIAAAKLGHSVVMSPTSCCYFDYTYETTPVEKVYSFDPVPAGLDSVGSARILGGQANFWSHIDRTETKMDQQIYPRLIALSEALWTVPGSKNYPDFLSRLGKEYPRLNNLKIPFHQPK